MIIIISVGTDGRTSDYRERTKTAAKAAANEKAAKVNYNLFRSSENERANESARRKKQKAKEGSIIAGHFKTEAQNVWSENKRGRAKREAKSALQSLAS